MVYARVRFANPAQIQATPKKDRAGEGLAAALARSNLRNSRCGGPWPWPSWGPPPPGPTTTRPSSSTRWASRATTSSAASARPTAAPPPSPAPTRPGAWSASSRVYVGTWTSNLDFKPVRRHPHQRRGRPLRRLATPERRRRVSLDPRRPVLRLCEPAVGRPRRLYRSLRQGDAARYGARNARQPRSTIRPQFTGHTGEAWYTEAKPTPAYTLSKAVSSPPGALGRQSIAAGGSYTTWNAGLTWTLTPHLSLDARYWDTNEHNFGTPYHARAVAALKATF